MLSATARLLLSGWRGWVTPNAVAAGAAAAPLLGGGGRAHQHHRHPAADAARSAARRLSTSSDALATAGLTEEEADARALAADFAAAELTPDLSAAWDETKTFPRDVIARAAGLGFGALVVKSHPAGTGLSRAAAAGVYEALAAGDVPVAAYLSIHNMVAAAIDAHGTPDQKDEHLPALATAQALGAYCLTEPGAGSDAAALRTRAVPAADGGDAYVLTGEKCFISGAGVADLYLVMARTGEPGSGASGISSFLVPATAPGLAVGPPERKMGWNAQPTATVRFDGVRVPASARLGAEGAGFRIAMAALDGGRVNIGACSVGGAARAVDAARAYAAQRVAFGTPLLAKPTVRAAFADMTAAIQSSRLLVRHAARSLDAGAATATLDAALAKRHATDACFGAANAALQVFGGYGYLADYHAERAVRDLRVHSILEGANEIMRLVVARELDRLDGGEAGR